MTEQLGDLVEAGAGTGQVAPEGVAQLVRNQCAEQVHHDEVTAGRLGVLGALELVGVERPDDESIEGHGARVARLRPRGVGVVPPGDVQVGAVHLAAEPAGIGGQMDVASPQPADLASPELGAGHRQHDERVAGRATGPEQRHDVLVSGPVDRGIRLVQAVPAPQAPRDLPVLAAASSGSSASSASSWSSGRSRAGASPAATAWSTKPRTAVSTIQAWSVGVPTAHSCQVKPIPQSSATETTDLSPGAGPAPPRRRRAVGRGPLLGAPPEGQRCVSWAQDEKPAGSPGRPDCGAGGDSMGPRRSALGARQPARAVRPVP